MDDARPRDMSRTGEAFVSTASRVERRRGRNRGYTPNHLPKHVRAQLKAWEETSLPASMFDALVYLGSVAAMGALTVLAWRSSEILGVVVYLLALVFIARQQRAIELMVHEASHWSWDRVNKTQNDRLADAIVAFPMMSTTNSYRKGHFIHHGTYAGEQDPCRRRFAAMGIGHLDLSSKWKITRAVLRWLPSYNLAYYTEIGSKSFSMLLRWTAWHSVVAIAPLSLIFGFTTGMFYWALFWLVPMFTSLPVLRSIAEAEEHDYERGETEVDSTFTNNGLIHHLLWHPWNDAYHQIHHLYPNISQRLHHKVHKLLMEHDEAYRQSPMRTHTLQPLPE